MRRYVITLSLILFLVFVFSGPRTLYHNARDYFVWKEITALMAENNVNTINIGSYKPDKALVLRHLRESKFKESNWLKHGPTPESAITLSLKNGDMLYFSHWGGDTFETIYQGNQFFISNYELGKLVTTALEGNK